MAQLVSRLDWNQPRCWSEPSRYMSAGHFCPCEAAQHREVRRAGVEPHVDGVGDLAVLRGIDAEVLAGRREPGLDAALRDAGRGLLEQPLGVGMQLVGLAVEEEGQRHAPVALARKRPVRAVGDHRLDARASPRRDRTSCSRSPAAPSREACGRRCRGLRRRRRHVHADEPLRRRAEDDRRLVAPAMRVAVAEGLAPAAARRSPAAARGSASPPRARRGPRNAAPSP